MALPFLSSLFGGQPAQPPAAALTPSTPMAQQVDTAANPGHGLLFGNYRDPSQEMAQLALFSQLASGQNVQDQMNFAPTLIPMQQAMAAKQQAADTRNKTVAMLQQSAPELATAVQSGAISPSDALAQLFKQQQQAKEDAKPKFQVLPDGSYGWVHSDTGKIDIAGKAPKSAHLISTQGGLIYDPESGQWISPPANLVSAQTKYGVTPIYFTDKDGNKHIALPGENGSLKMIDNPDGMTPMPGVSNVDLGTQVMQIDKKTGQPVATYAKDLAGKAQQEELGKSQATAQTQLAGAHQTADMIQQGVTDLISDPDLANALGPINSRLPTVWPSTARVEAKINQTTGQAFLQARNLLKGGGAITDYEGQKAEAAYARLSTAQNKDDFVQALKDFNSAVQEGVKKLDAQAGGKWSPTANQPGSATQPVTAVNPKTGQRLILQNGQWVPAQ